MSKDVKKIKVKNKITKRKVVTVGIIFTYVIFVLISFIVMFCNQENNVLEETYYIAQILASVFVVSGVVIAVWQYYLSKRNENRQMKMITIQKSIDLAEYYKDNILKLFNALIYVYKVSKITDILDDIKINDMKKFDIYELQKLLRDEKRKELDKIQNSDEFVNAILQADKIYRLNLNLGEEIVKVEDINEETKIVKAKINKAIVKASFRYEIIQRLMNNLEYFALHFEHGTADETAVYQSLHQTYIEIVHNLYYNIAHSNSDLGIRYYTNVIGLFNMWNNRKNQKQEEILNEARNSTHKGNVVEKIDD